MTTTPPEIAALRPRLQAGVHALGVHLQTAQADRLIDYLSLIVKWTRVYNLTALRAPEDMLTHHLLDSLAVIAPLQREIAARQRLRASPASPVAAPARPQRLLDVGAGAGLPGVVIAICCPDITVTCVDTVAKKAAFVQQVAAALGLGNLHGRHARVEALTESFDIVTSRAFASLADFAALSVRALSPDGVWMAMKGRHPHDEIAALPRDVTVFHVEPLLVPGLDADRCLVWMRPAAPHV